MYIIHKLIFKVSHVRMASLARHILLKWKAYIYKYNKLAWHVSLIGRALCYGHKDYRFESCTCFINFLDRINKKKYIL